MPWLICLRFSMSWFFGLGISMSWFFGLGISMSWFFGLGISMIWFFGLWNLDVMVYVSPWPRFRYHRENKKLTHNYAIMLLKNTLVVQIYATSICIMYASAN